VGAQEDVLLAHAPEVGRDPVDDDRQGTLTANTKNISGMIRMIVCCCGLTAAVCLLISWRWEM
jgi:hypothetical protein